MARLALALGLLLSVSTAWGQVPVELRDGERNAMADAYEATVAEDGMLTSLKIGGQEWMEARPDNPRGAYCWIDGPLTMPDVTQPETSVVEAVGEKSKIRYEFNEDSVRWTVENLTDESMLNLIVFAPVIDALLDASGIAVKAPTAWGGKLITFFSGETNIRLTGGTRWPWDKVHQCWEVRVGPKETREVTLEINPASKEQIAQAARTAARADTKPVDPDGPMWDLDALSAPPQTYPAEGFDEDGVRALFYDGPSFQGRPTRVFAWVGLPEVEPGEKVPAMVLVHGGGGTAFASWVRRWTERGYAAISMDTCGCVPSGAYGAWDRHEHGGPPGWGGWGQIDWPREDQWTHQAVSAAILAHSLLRSLSEVDPDRVGLTGISWGGYLASIIAGVDTRYRCAIPVYGCGYTLDMPFSGSVQGLGEEGADRWMRWWDPSVYLKDVTAPICWVTGSNDFAYTFPGLRQSARAVKGPVKLCVRLRMPHGHGDAGEAPEETFTFADTFLKGGDPMAEITGQGREGSEVWCEFTCAVPVVRAELNTTRDTGSWPGRAWLASEANLTDGRVTAALPEGTTVYYINLFDERDLCVSTEHVEIDG